MKINFKKINLKLQRRQLLLFILLFTVSLFCVFLAYNKVNPTYKIGEVVYTRDIFGRTIAAERLLKKDLSSNTTLTPTPEDYSQTISNWEIVDNSQSPPLPTGLYFYQESPGYSDVIKWGDYLIGFTKDRYIAESTGGCFGGCSPSLQSTIRHIRILNIKTGEVYSISLQKPTWGEIDMVYPQLIENTYFLKVGSYGPRNAGFEYRLKLPPTRTSKIEKLQKPIGTIIYQFGNYYLTASCYEGCYYQRVETTTLKASELKRLNEASNQYIDTRPEKLLGFTKNGEMVLEVSTTKETIAVSLLDEKTVRKFDGNKNELLPSDANNSSESIQKQFEALGLDNKYVLVERVTKYPTNKAK